MGDVVRIKPEYEAISVQFTTDEGFVIAMSGTLQGWIDFSIVTSQGNLTYPLTPDDAHQIIAGLHAVCADIQANCQFDRDPRLYDTNGG